ncbi:MAG: hypothetical protein R2730_00610 [Chitinophagales bacterium]
MLLFEIPVYRLSNQSFNSELTKMLDRTFKADIVRNHSIDFYTSFKKSYLDRHRVCWRYNDIIGYIQIVNNKIDRGVYFEYFLRDSKRMYRGCNKNFKQEDYSKLGFEYDDIENSNQVADLVFTLLKEINQEQIFKKRYFDLEIFLHLYKKMDWLKIIMG